MKVKPESLANLKPIYGSVSTYDKDKHCKIALDYIRGGYRKEKQRFPTGAGLAKVLGISQRTVYNWGDKCEEFAYVLDALMQEQEIKLIDHGLHGEYNSTITKLLLSRHGYSDKQETDITTNGQSINKVEIVALSAADGDS